MKKQIQLQLAHPATAPEALSQASGLSKQAIKCAMVKGAVWVMEKGKRVRLRKVTRQLPAGTQLWLFYDEALLARTPPAAICVHKEKGFSVWFKPAGLVTQGSQWGDHLSLMRQVEKQLGKPVWLVHRLDRETPGLVVLAHHRQAAGWLSQQFQQRKVEKVYYAWVHGRLTGAGELTTPLDGKPAHTAYEAVGHRTQPVEMTSVKVALKTGRLHQIRRHFAQMGHPVVGDPRYAEGMPRLTLPLQLLAWRLALRPHPKGERQVFELSEALWYESGVLQYTSL